LHNSTKNYRLGELFLRFIFTTKEEAMKVQILAIAALLFFTSTHTLHKENPANSPFVYCFDAQDEVNEDIWGDIPLVTAIEQKDLEKVKRLLAHPQIDVNKYDKEGKTPLYHVLDYQYPSLLKVLLQHPNIDVNKPDLEGRTPLYLAAASPHLVECLYLLLAHPTINVNEQNINGMTALHSAALLLKKDTIQAFLKHPLIDTTLKDLKGRTALDLAKNSLIQVADDVGGRLLQENKNAVLQVLQDHEKSTLNP
jgi:hypothetical protein